MTHTTAAVESPLNPETPKKEEDSPFSIPSLRVSVQDASTNVSTEAANSPQNDPQRKILRRGSAPVFYRSLSTSNDDFMTPNPVNPLLFSAQYSPPTSPLSLPASPHKTHAALFDPSAKSLHVHPAANSSNLFSVGNMSSGTVDTAIMKSGVGVAPHIVSLSPHHPNNSARHSLTMKNDSNPVSITLPSISNPETETLNTPNTAKDPQLSPSSPLPNSDGKNNPDSLTNSHILRRRQRAAQRKLRVAIRNDSIRTGRQLQRFNTFAGVAILLSFALVLIDAVLSTQDIQHFHQFSKSIAMTSERQTYLVFMTLNYYIYYLLTHNPMATKLPTLFGTPASGFELADVFHDEAVLMGDRFLARSREVDEIESDSKDLMRLRHVPTIDAYVPYSSSPSKYMRMKMTMEDMVALSHSLFRVSLYEKQEDFQKDIGYMFLMSNFVSRITTNAFDLNTEYLVEEAHAREDMMILVSTILFVIIVVTMIILGVVFLLPILLQAERNKLRVLNIFTSIPPNVQKTLKSRALRLYKLVQRIDDEEDDSGDTADADHMSSAGSETTSMTQATAVTPENYGDVFKRYNNYRNINVDFSRHTVSQSTTSQIARDDTAGIELRATKMAQKLDSSFPAQLLSSATSQRNLALEQMASTSPHDSARNTHLAMISNDGVIPPPSPAHNNKSSRHNTSRDDLVEQGKKKYNIWSGAAVVTGISRYSLLLIILVIYFSILLGMTNTLVAQVDDALIHISQGNLRNPHLGYAFLFTLEHLLHDVAEERVLNPTNPLTFIEGTFSSEAARMIDLAREGTAGLLYGGYYGLTSPTSDQDQIHLFFDSPCDTDPAKYAHHYRYAAEYPYVLTTCKTVFNGFLDRGLYSSFMYLYSQLHSLLNSDYNKVLQHFLTGGTPTADPAMVESVRSTFSHVFHLYYDYMFHFFR